MKNISSRLVACLAGLALFFVAAHIMPAQQPQPNPNTRAARLSYVEGQVQIAQGNQILANPALANTPLFEGTIISTREDGRAEIQLDNGSVVRVAPNSSLKISALRQQDNVSHAEMLLQSGLAYFELQADSPTNHTVARFDDSEVTAASGLTVLRMNVDNPPGEVSVFSGNAHLERGSVLSLDLHGGESVALNGSDPNLYNLAETIEPDSWDSWNADRDEQLTSEQGARTAASSGEPNPGNPAWGDLDANGNWYNVPGQGYVWSPYEAASGDWDPYGCGNWVWNPPYGYVWVSCEQWGYLPYASGNWNYYDDFGWGWSPGYGYPWWNTGLWGWNIGIRPPHYLPPHRPRGGPITPVGAPIRRGNGFYQPNPVIAVNRIPSSPAARPAHIVGGPVTIGGATVQPLRPLSPRPTYGSSGANGFTNGYRVFGATAPRTGGGYIPWANSPSRAGGAAPGYRPPSAPRPYSGGSTASRPSGGSPHVSSGGGAGHPSGGGGGGGGAHAGGGGGGGGHH
jgi:hypothetical protein